MNILTVTNSPLDLRLGSGKTVLRFADGLRRLGHHVDVLGPDDCAAWPHWRRAKQLRQGIGSLSAIARASTARRYDVIEFYGAEFWPAIVRLSHGRRRPLLIAHTNGLELLHYERERQYDAARGLKRAVSRAAHTPLFRLAFRQTDALVTLSEADRAFALSQRLYPPGMTAVVEPGLDDEFHMLTKAPVDHRENRVCFTGSWTRRKGTALLVAVMARIFREHPDVQFDVFGASPDAALVTASFDADLRDRITVHGWLTNPELVAKLRRGKVFFFPSQYEGYGLAVIEAMACGLAVVTTATGVGASLQPDIEATVCEFDAVEQMTGAIGRFLRDEEFRSRVAAAGERRAKVLHWDLSAEKLGNTYARWLQHPSLTSPKVQ